MLVIFFAITAVVLLMKRYGLAVNWIGYLPIAKVVFFPKYQEPILGFAVAVLCALGFSYLFENIINKNYIVLAVGVALGVLILSSVASMVWLFNDSTAIFFNLSMKLIIMSIILIILSLILIIFIALILLLYLKKKNIQNILQAVLFVILITELFFSFFFPCFIYPSILPNRNTNPYDGAPYISFLQNRIGDYSRVFGRDRILLPNWSGVFGIQDVRLHDAILYKKYLLFARNFLLLEQQPGQMYGDLYDRFDGVAEHTEYTETEDYPFDSLAEKRFLQLSSVKYILSMKPYSQVQFKNIYDREIKIYEYDDVLPRASIFYGATLVNNDDQTLSILKDPSFNIFQKVVVLSSSISNKQAILLGVLEHSPARNLDAAKIVSYQSQKVDIDADLQQPGLLMLNDSNYPGWKVYVDGHERQIMDVDYLFRGVLLDSGQHKIEFRYQPLSFYIGVSISGGTLLLIVACSIVLFKRKRSGL